MNPHTDPMSFAPPPPSELERLLLKLQWQNEGGLDGVWETWREPNGEERVVVPLDASRGDFERLRARALERLRSKVPARHWALLLAELEMETNFAAVPAIWQKEASTLPGTIPWIMGQLLHESVTTQLTSSARSTVERRAVLGRSHEYVGKYLLERTLLAPSGVGSYIVTALVPARSPLYLKDERPVGSERGADLHRPFIEPAAVIQTLDLALAAIAERLDASDHDTRVMGLLESVPSGVSAELLAAVANFAAGSAGAVRLPTFLWSGDLSVREHVFEPPSVSSLQEAAKRLLEGAPPTLARIEGLIVALRREADSADPVATVFTTSTGPVRRVRVHLDDPTYERAVAAHQHNQLVRLDGELRREGRMWHMRGVKLVVLSPEVAEDCLDQADSRAMQEELGFTE